MASTPWRKTCLLGIFVLAGLTLHATTVRSQDQAQALASVLDAGGRVQHESMDPEKPVESIDFATKPVGDDILKELTAFPELKKLTLNNTSITDEGLKHLSGLERLERLYLVDTGITDVGVERLRELPAIKVLSLVGTKISDTSVETIQGMESLETVFLAGTNLSDDALRTLREARPMLEVVR